MDNKYTDLEKLDKVFPYLHESGKFNLVDCIPSDIDFVMLNGINLIVEEEISNLLTKNGYAIVNRDNYPDYIAELTDKGREAKKAGGHFAYLKKLTDKERHETESLKYDLLQKKFIYKARYTPYLFSFLALIGTILSLVMSYKALHKDQVLIPQTIDTLEHKLKNGFELPMDTTLKQIKD